MGLLDLENRALITDLYQLTMSASYFSHDCNPTAAFEMFVRNPPENRGYLIFAGLEQALEFLEGFKFLPEEISWLKANPSLKHLPKAWFDFMAELKFTGEVWALEEGEPFFAGEPVLQVRAPLIQAQLMETYLLSLLNFQSLIATKASRVAEAARGRQVVDFGARRAHGPEASVLAARAAFIGGCSGTSNVYAARKLGIPAIGTMAHSYVMAFQSEKEAFENYLKDFPESAALLIDTYDTIHATHLVAELKGEVKAVRLDSGDLLQLSKSVRRILDQAGKKSTRIIVSGDLNEYLIDDLLRKKAPIDLFGVGTELVTSRDAPALGGVYKLVEIGEGAKSKYTLKLSLLKATYPALKQVFRKQNDKKIYSEDLIGCPEEKPGGRPLLRKVMEKGKRLGKAPELKEIQEKALAELKRLPPRVKSLDRPGHFPVKYSEKLRRLRQKLVLEIKREQGLL